VETLDVEPELELDNPDELDEVLWELDEPVLLESDDPAPLEPDEVPVEEVAAAFRVAAATRAGSWPVASWTRITAVVARKIAAAIAATRPRISETLRLRARRRSSASRRGSVVTPDRGTRRRAAGEGSPWVEPSIGVIVSVVVGWEMR
jgi:hypothetical protein